MPSQSSSQEHSSSILKLLQVFKTEVLPHPLVTDFLHSFMAVAGQKFVQGVQKASSSLWDRVKFITVSGLKWKQLWRWFFFLASRVLYVYYPKFFLREKKTGIREHNADRVSLWPLNVWKCWTISRKLFKNLCRWKTSQRHIYKFPKTSDYNMADPRNFDVRNIFGHLIYVYEVIS